MDKTEIVFFRFTYLRYYVSISYSERYHTVKRIILGHLHVHVKR